LVSLIVKDSELRGIKEASGIQPVDLNKIPPVLAAITQVNRSGCRPKRTEGRGDTSCRRRHALSGPRRHMDHQAGLFAELCRWRARDDFDRLHRVRRKLIRKYIALLVVNRLAINAKRVGSIITKSVEQAIRISRNARRSQRHERAERRGL